MKKINFTFFGTDEFSIGILSKLEKAGFLPSVVVTAPDRPKGRGLVTTAPVAKIWAEEHKIPVLQPEKLDENFVSEHLSRFANHSQNVISGKDAAVAGDGGRGTGDKLFVVASYGKIIPQSVLDIPKHGTLNVHPSLLPKWRGASPIEAQILNDDRDVGVTIMVMDEKMDHGPILNQEFVEAPYWPMRGSELQKLLAEEGGRLLTRTIPEWIEGNIDAQEQEHELATFCSKIQKEDGLIDLEDDVYKNLLKIRAYDAWPRAYFFTKDGKRVIITDAKMEDDRLVIKRVIPEGKKEMEYQNFLNLQQSL